MKYTYDLNTNGCLILTVDTSEQEEIKILLAEEGPTIKAEHQALEGLIDNSDLSWIGPEEIGALTSAPILGLRDENGEPTAAWGFMNYAVRSFLEDLVKTGQAIFIS